MKKVKNYSFITFFYLDSNESVINAIATAECPSLVYSSLLHPNGLDTVPHSHKR